MQTLVECAIFSTTITIVLWPFFRDHPCDPCQKRTSGLYGARED